MAMFIAHFHKNMEQDRWEIARVVPYTNFYNYFARMQEARSMGYKQFGVEAADELEAFMKAKDFAEKHFG